MVNLVVESISVRSLDIDFFEVSWKLKPTSEDLLDYTFQVLRSEAGGGPFAPVSPELEDQYIFVDKTIRVGNDFREWFYKILVKCKADGTTKEFGPADPGPDADLIALELRKHMNLLFREFNGRRCWVLPVRTFGQRCSCWDVILSKRTQSNCATCFDTGFVRGYHTPIESWISIDPDQKSKQDFNVGPTQQSNTTARLGYFPPLKPQDVVVEAENIRWRVVQVSGTEQLRAPVHQEIQMHKIPSSDIEYRIPIVLETALRNLWLGPARNFTNPQNLENFMGEEFPKIFQLYGSTYPPVRT